MKELYELEVTGEAIVLAKVTGGGGEGLLISYCIEPLVAQPDFLTSIRKEIAEGIRLELPSLELVNDQQLRTHRCCFKGSTLLPPDEAPGKWDVHLIVQNINHVPDGPPL